MEMVSTVAPAPSILAPGDHRQSMAEGGAWGVDSQTGAGVLQGCLPSMVQWLSPFNGVPALQEQYKINIKNGQKWGKLV